MCSIWECKEITDRPLIPESPPLEVVRDRSLLLIERIT